MTARRIAFVFAIALLAAACGQKPAEKKEETAAPAKTPAVAATPATAEATKNEAAATPAAAEPAAPRVFDTPGGAKVEMLAEGTGPLPQKGQKIRMHYTGTLEDGTKFDSSFDHPGAQPLAFNLGEGQVIKGWDEATAMLTVGSKARVTIPPELGYGRRAMGPIPANATLIFDVELVSAE